MPQSFVLQCVALLLEEPPNVNDVVRGLGGWPLAPLNAAEGPDGWITAGPGFGIDRRGGRKIYIDAFDRPWPDDPRAIAELPALAAAWRSGVFGPVSEPGGLARAKAQCWAWPGGPDVAARHRAVLRVRSTIELPDAAPREPPKGYDPIHDLWTLTELASGLLKVPAASAVYFPGGEAVRSREQVQDVMTRKTGAGPIPLDLWVNIRAIGIGQDAGARWMVADTVGMRQLRLPDQEAIYAEGQEEPDAVAELLRNACFHLADGKAIADGSTSDDPRGRRWKASSVASLLSPSRPVIRWLPEASARPSEAFLARGKAR